MQHNIITNYEALIQYKGLCILGVEIQLNPHPNRHNYPHRRDYMPSKKKNRGNKRGYMLYINRTKPFLSTGGFGYRVHTKKYLRKLIDYIIVHYEAYLQKNEKIKSQEELTAFRDIVPDSLRNHHDIGFKDFFPTFYEMLNAFNDSSGLVDDINSDK
jgi:hypothetical protein